MKNSATEAKAQTLRGLAEELVGRPGYADLHATAVRVLRAVEGGKHPAEIESAARVLNSTASDLFGRNWLNGDERSEQRVAAQIYGIACQ